MHQDPRLNIIPYENMQTVVKFMIESFRDANGGQPPAKIIWYRGGASVGSLQTILKNELVGKRSVLCSIHKSCKITRFRDPRNFGKLATRLQARNNFHLHCSQPSSKDVRSK